MSLIYVSRNRPLMSINRATGCIEKQELDSGKDQDRVAGEQELLQEQRHGKDAHG